MLSADTLVAFVMASVVLSVAPGPDNLFVLIQSATQGRKAGALVTLGLCTGLLVHTTLVVVGVAGALRAMPGVFEGVKLVGVVYLGYLALQAYRATPTLMTTGEPLKLSGGVLYTRGIVMNVTNPKVAIFFLAFLPQFTHVEAGPIALQLGVLGGVFIVVALSCFLLIAYLSGFLHRQLSTSAKIQLYLNRMVALVLLGLAVNLLLTSLDA